MSFLSASALQMTGGLEEGLMGGTQVGVADGWGINLGVRGLNGVLVADFMFYFWWIRLASAVPLYQYMNRLLER